MYSDQRILHVFVHLKLPSMGQRDHCHGGAVTDSQLQNHSNVFITECKVMQLIQTLFAYMQIISLPIGLAEWDTLFLLVDPNLSLVTLDFIKV